MKRYYVSVTEHLNKVVSVDAESENEAVQKVQDAYNNSDIILDADNFSGEVIEIEPDQEYWRESEEDKPKDTPYLTHAVVLFAIEQRYKAYKHSVPSERSESHRRYYFKALPEKELSDEDMMYGERREVARCKLELYVLMQLLRGNLAWENRWGTWFWRSENDRDLIILRDWVEPNKGGA